MPTDNVQPSEEPQEAWLKGGPQPAGPAHRLTTASWTRIQSQITFRARAHRCQQPRLSGAFSLLEGDTSSPLQASLRQPAGHSRWKSTLCSGHQATRRATMASEPPSWHSQGRKLEFTGSKELLPPWGWPALMLCSPLSGQSCRGKVSPPLSPDETPDSMSLSCVQSSAASSRKQITHPLSRKKRAREEAKEPQSSLGKLRSF